MNNRVRALVILAIFPYALTGCISHPKEGYYWGHYEQLIHDMYIKPGSADTSTQVQRLTQDIQQAQSVGKPIAPGIYAHLGFMYALKGNLSQAQDAFNEEKSLYPESAVFIDGMMSRALKERKGE